MKTIKTFLMFSLLFVTVGYSAGDVTLPIDPETGKVTYSGIVVISNAKAGEIFVALKKYIASTYNSAKAVIQAEDKDAGMIEGNGAIALGGTADEGAIWTGDAYDLGEVKYKISFRVKDGKFKYSFTDFNHILSARKITLEGGGLENERSRSEGLIGIPVKGWKSIRQKTGDIVSLMVLNLKTFVPKEIKKNDDWGDETPKPVVTTSKSKPSPAPEDLTDTNKRDSDGKTLLMQAAIFGTKERVEFLIKNKADVNLVDPKGRTALFYAVAQNKIEIVETLITAKADVNIKDADGYSPLKVAMENKFKGIITLLKEAGAK